MDAFGLPTSPNIFRYVFTGNASSGSTSWQRWTKPQGKANFKMFLVGAGGRGGNGVVGANSTAGGGGGGSSATQTIINCPLEFVPDVLYIQCGYTAGQGSRVAMFPEAGAIDAVTFAFAVGGNNGGNGSGGTGGSGGTAPNAATAAQMPLGFAFANVLNGHAGSAGGNAVAGSNLAWPTTGLHITGGAGGGGLPGAGAVGTDGGSISSPGAASPFRVVPGGLGAATATTVPGAGATGRPEPMAGIMFLGGAGGGSTHGSATGAGLQQSNGGDGAYGCGGGGRGGALTTSANGVVGAAGLGLCIIWVS